VAIVRPNQVWSSDITYVPMPHGWMYLTVVMDWFSRYALSWRLSNTLDGLFCLEALEEALSRGTPEIFNTDQGAQYTATAFFKVLDSKSESWRFSQYRLLWGLIAASSRTRKIVLRLIAAVWASLMIRAAKSDSDHCAAGTPWSAGFSVANSATR
jgi:transposase InsO family protein